MLPCIQTTWLTCRGWLIQLPRLNTGQKSRRHKNKDEGGEQLKLIQIKKKKLRRDKNRKAAQQHATVNYKCLLAFNTSINNEKKQKTFPFTLCATNATKFATLFVCTKCVCTWHSETLWIKASSRYISYSVESKQEMLFQGWREEKKHEETQIEKWSGGRKREWWREIKYAAHIEKKRPFIVKGAKTEWSIQRGERR